MSKTTSLSELVRTG